MSKADIIVLCIYLVFVITLFVVMLYRFFHRPKNVKFLITFVEAETGQGKTSLSIALAKLWHKRYESVVREQFMPELETLKQNGYPLLEMPDTLCHSDTTAFLELDKDGNPTKPFMDCDFSRFDIPTEENYKNIDYYPFGSYFIFDEIVNKARNRNWMSFDDSKGVCLDLHRKVGYNITFISPDMSSAEKTLRDSAHIIREVFGTEISTNRKGKITSITWYFVDYYGKNKIENADKGVLTPGTFKPFEFYPDERKEIMKWKYTFKGDIFKYYDSYRERLYFYRHLTKFKNKPCKMYFSSRFDSSNLVKDHPLMQVKKDTRSVKEKRQRINKEN